MDRDKSCLSYWYPRIRNCVPTPPTEIVTLDDDETAELISQLELPSSYKTLQFLISWYVDMSERWGTIFMRTGQGSGKHEWSKTCYCPDYQASYKHIMSLVEWSMSVDILGLPVNVWVARKYLDVEPLGVCPEYNGMPIVPEWRVFIKDGQVICHHPYWPTDAIVKGLVDPSTVEGKFGRTESIVQRAESSMACTPSEVLHLACEVGKCIDGSWSVDILKAADGYYVTDMAVAEMSWHWPSCPNSALSDVETMFP